MLRSFRFYLLVVLYIVQSVEVYAVKAYPHPIDIVQPDGTLLTIRVHGDENFKFRTTVDGYLIDASSDGIYHYATVTENGLELTAIKAKNTNERSNSEKIFIRRFSSMDAKSKLLQKQRLKKAPAIVTESVRNAEFPSTGSPRSLVILVNFSNKSFITPNPKQAFTDLLNKENYSENGATGSARDYFKMSSFHQFTPQFDVVGPFTLANTLEFYGENNANDDDRRPQEMIIDACRLADNNGVNFANYDLDADGIVDNVFVFFAGNNEAEGAPKNTIWPHRWNVGNFNNKFDNKAIYNYACTSELKGSAGSTKSGIGTFCHEFGHVLGLVDYYHTTDDKPTLENWSIMDAGAYNNNGRTPPLYSAYDRFELGWIAPTVLTTPTNILLKPLQSSNRAFLISETDQHNLQGRNPNPNEYFILENRRKTGFDAFLPGEGLLIWHINYNQNAWDNNSPNNYTGNSQTAASHMRVYLQPLVGNSSTPGQAFTSGSFTPTLWSGTRLNNKQITDIGLVSQDVIFKYRGGIFEMLPPVALDARDVTNRSFIASWEEVLHAKNYFLTAYRISAGKSKEIEEFSNNLELPKGWKTNLTAVTTSANFSGANIPALQFAKTNEYLLTKIYPEVVDSLSFYIRSLNSNGSVMKVEAYDKLNWTFIDSIQVGSSLHEYKKYAFAASKNYVQFRLTYLSANGAVAIDDVAVSYGSKLEYVYINKVLTATFDTIKHLIPNAEYRYQLMTSDNYDNTTEVSNTISVQTLAHDDSMMLRIDRIRNTNDFFVYPVNLSDPILIYDMSGRLIANIKPADYKVKISNYLKQHGVYLIRAGMRQNRLIF